MSNIIDSIQLSGTTYQIQGSGGGVPESAFTAYTAATDARIAEDEEVTAAALNELNEAISGVSGNNVVELTQAEYDALVDKDPTAFYIITDATAGDLTNYYTKSETNTLLNGKQATLVSGTNIKTINNESILGSGNIVIQGGGKAVSGGRGITVTTGATADTVSFNLAIYDRGNTSVSECHEKNNNIPICRSNYCHLEQPLGSIDSNSNSSHKEGIGSKIGGDSYNSHVEGYYCEVGNLSPYSHAEGQYTKTSNQSEHASGQYNASSRASNTFGNSGNTLFSVGNGTSTSARHNAFEIRQNGDIYLTKDGQDVKLQDQLGGGGGGTVDQTIISGSTNAVAGGAVYDKFDEVEQVTAAGLNAVNDKFDGLKLKKLTQAEYNALATKDASTLYVIVN